MRELIRELFLRGEGKIFFEKDTERMGLTIILVKIGINVYSGAVSLHVARCKFNTVQMFMENFTYGTNVSANMKKSTCTRTSANFVYTNVNRKIHIRTTQMSRETVEKFKHVRT